MARRPGGTDLNTEDDEYIYGQSWYMNPLSLAQWPNSIVTSQDYSSIFEGFTLAVARYADLAPLLPPSLESFTLMTSEGESQPPPLSLAEIDLLLPSLKSLRLDGTFYSPLSHITIPRIEALSLISTCPFKGKYEESLPQSIFNTTEHVELPYSCPSTLLTSTSSHSADLAKVIIAKYHNYGAIRGPASHMTANAALQQQFAAVTLEQTSVSLACAVNRQQQYQASVDTARPESSRGYLGETEGATAALEETTGIDALSTFELNLSIEQGEMQPIQGGEGNQDVEELGDVKVIKKREKRMLFVRPSKSWSLQGECGGTR
ncbi:hypothetical protein CPB86DRAFT_877837 [Serendipita vermifera]|nr:hypothetical protein CPB86DRAFT_877837 [Serendipita vermifera]